MTAHAITADTVAATVARLRERRPRVHCITNSAAVNFTANVLLSAGCIPSMTVNPEEVPDFVAGADALLVNLGTLDPLRQDAIAAAIEVAAETGKPWVLDPVFVERSRIRLALAKRLAMAEPAAIRLNRAELTALMGGEGNDDTQDTAPDHIAPGGDESAAAYALATLSTVVRTGDVDFITDGVRSLIVEGGHPTMALVTAAGCAATALLAGFLAVEPDAVVASAVCLAFVAAAAEQAGMRSYGPGTFSPAFIDALYWLPPEEIGASARIT